MKIDYTIEKIWNLLSCMAVNIMILICFCCCYRLSLVSVNHHKGLPLESREVLLEVATVKLYPWMSSISI